MIKLDIGQFEADVKVVTVVFINENGSESRYRMDKCEGSGLFMTSIENGEDDYVDLYFIIG